MEQLRKWISIAKRSNDSGVLLLELLITMGLAAILLPTLLISFMAIRDGQAQKEQRAQAVSLLIEAKEAVRSVRDADWNTFAQNNGTYHVTVASDKWTLLADEYTDPVSKFTTNIQIAEVKRLNGVIDDTGTVDPSTKKVTTTISWTLPSPSSITDISYLTRHENLAVTQDTFADFDPGIKTNTFVSATGEVTLGAGGGGGDWCAPSSSPTQIDLPKSGVANAIMVAKGPAANGATVFAGTGDNAAGAAIAKQEVQGDPPIPSTQTTYDGSSLKTNGVFGEVIDGTAKYAYLATDKNDKEVVILDITQYTDPPTNTKFKEIGSINVPGNVNANSVYVVNDKAYIITSNSKLFIYDITNRSKNYTTSEALNGSGTTISGAGKKIIINGSYAYIATSTTTFNFQIFDVGTNPAAPTLTGQRTLGTSQTGVDVYVNPDAADPARAYFVTTYSAGKPEFFVVNISNKSTPTPVGSGYNTNGMNPTGVTVVTGNKAIIVGTGGTEQYQVIKLDNENLPTHCAGLPYSSGVYGVASALLENGYAYSYIITGDASNELKIILGGAGGNYVSSGQFESNPIYTPSPSSFNWFIANISKPAQTDLQMQVAVADAISGSCSGVAYTYLGPDGDPGQYYTSTDSTTIQGVIPFTPDTDPESYKNPGQCFRYKAWFSTNDSTAAPAINDVTVNYSP